MQQQQKKHAKK